MPYVAVTLPVSHELRADLIRATRDPACIAKVRAAAGRLCTWPWWKSQSDIDRAYSDLALELLPLEQALAWICAPDGVLRFKPIRLAPNGVMDVHNVVVSYSAPFGIWENATWSSLQSDNFDCHIEYVVAAATRSARPTL